MPRKEEFHLKPLGYRHDPEVERIRLSTLDYLTACTYNNFAVFFALDNGEKTKVCAILKRGLEMTLAQCRHLVGRIEKNEDDDDYSFVKRRSSTVQFNVQWLDSPDDSFPSYSDIERSQFISSGLDFATLSVEGMTYGEKPTCLPDAEPLVSGFQANFIPGGLIFNMHHHHYANDVMGWSSFVHQLAENCYSIVNKTPPPAWDLACLDHSRFTSNVPADEKVDGPSPPERHPDHLPSSSLLFHLPESKAAELKKLATPEDGSWISTYDSFSALLWRILTKHRAVLFKPDMNSRPLWAETVNMRSRIDPPVPERLQRNVFWAVRSTDYPNQPTIAEVICDAPLSRLAVFIRMLTNGTTQEKLLKGLDMVAPVRDKVSLFGRIDSCPPMSIVVTDWRNTRVCEADFGFGRPKAFRHFMDTVTEGFIMVYPPRNAGPKSDEGCTFSVSVEKDIVKQVTEDPELTKYFEFRGFEAVN